MNGSDVIRPVVLTLVHGTFAAKATWIEPSSDFARQLAQDIGLPIEIRAFRWSGANNHPARKIAGDELARHLEEQFALYPGHDHFVVAHSHGGNVALHAQSKPDIAKKLAGIVTLGTPFIRCEPRSVEGLVGTFSAIGVLIDLLLRAFVVVALCCLINYLMERPNLQWLGMLLLAPTSIVAVGYMDDLRLINSHKS